MNLGDDASRLAAEARARVLIDRKLADAGWSVQDSRSLNRFAAKGVARREAAGQVFQPKPSGAPPSLGDSVDGESWGAENTKALESVMLAAIGAGVGFQFVNQSASGEIRVAVPSQGQLESGEQ